MRNDRNHSSIFWDRLEVPLGRGKDKTDSSLAKIDPIARADLGVGPGGAPPPFCGLSIISALHVQYRIQAFAKLHLRELQSRKFFRRSMPPKLSRKVRRF